MRIGDVDLSQRVLVVAEIGNNHEGDMEAARELIRQAAGTGAHAVKFQTFRPEHYSSRLDAERFAQLEQFALSYDEFGELAELARSLGILFLSTPLDLESARFLTSIVDALKVASGDIGFIPLLREVGGTDRPVIISTGISGLPAIETAHAEIQTARGDRPLDLAILHCVSAYPVPPEEANLRAIPLLAGRFHCPIGYSDHTLGTDAALAAVALGARIIEKHFTLSDTDSDFRDHKLSATPEVMAELVSRVTEVEAMLGEPKKEIGPLAEAIAESIQRSVAAAADLPAGHVVREVDLTWVRPGGGIPPGEEDRLIGRTLAHAIRAGEQIGTEDMR